MARLACVLNLDSIPFPYNHFDVIGGSGAGGILAIFLGRLRMSVDEAIEHFIDLYRTIMHPELDKATRSRKLVQYFKDLAQDHRMAELRPSCNVFVCAMPAACVTGRKPERFRNYTPRKFSSFDCKIWEAARATTADPSLFESMFIGPNWGPEEYVDPSGFGFGNPIDLVLEETKSLFSPHPQTLLLSLGAGHSGVFSLSRDGNELNSLFKAISEDCERTASKMEERDLEGYYRFNVAQGFQGIEPNDLSKPGVIAAHTKQHLGNFLIDRSLDEVVDFLAARYRQPASSPRALSQINPHIENLLLQIQTLNIFDFLLDRELVARPDYTFYTGRVYAEKRMLIQKFHGHTPYEDRDRALQSHILVRHPNLLAVFRKADDIPCIFYLNDNLIPAEERLARALELMDASELAHQGICLIGGLASGLDFLERNARQFLHGILHVQDFVVFATNDGQYLLAFTPGSDQRIDGIQAEEIDVELLQELCSKTVVDATWAAHAERIKSRYGLLIYEPLDRDSFKNIQEDSPPPSFLPPMTTFQSINSPHHRLFSWQKSTPRLTLTLQDIVDQFRQFRLTNRKIRRILQPTTGSLDISIPHEEIRLTLSLEFSIILVRQGEVSGHSSTGEVQDVLPDFSSNLDNGLSSANQSIIDLWQSTVPDMSWNGWKFIIDTLSRTETKNETTRTDICNEGNIQVLSSTTASSFSIVVDAKDTRDPDVGSIGSDSKRKQSHPSLPPLSQPSSNVMTSSTKRDAANRYSHTWERNEQITLHGYSSGPAHKPVHTSIVSINGHEFGRGEASTKSDAKELAARRAIKQLSGHFWS